MNKVSTIAIVCLGILLGGLPGAKTYAQTNPSPVAPAYFPVLPTTEPVDYKYGAKQSADIAYIYKSFGRDAVYFLQKGDIVAHKIVRERAECKRSGLSEAATLKRIDAIVDGSDKEWKRFKAARFTKPFNVNFSVDFPANTSIKK